MIQVLDTQTDGETNGWTDRQTDGWKERHGSWNNYLDVLTI